MFTVPTAFRLDLSVAAALKIAARSDALALTSAWVRRHEPDAYGVVEPPAKPAALYCLSDSDAALPYGCVSSDGHGGACRGVIRIVRASLQAQGGAA
jgi:hypothetical protein